MTEIKAVEIRAEVRQIKSMVDSYGKLWYKVGDCYTASWWTEDVE